MNGIGNNPSRALAAGTANVNFGLIPQMVAGLSAILSGTILNRSVRDQRIPWQMHSLTSTRNAPSPVSVLLNTLRWILAAVAAVVITMVLLFIMQTLIKTGETVIQKIVAVEYADFIRVRADERVETRAEKPKKMMPEEMPEMLDPREPLEQDAGGIKIGYAMSGLTRDRMNLAGMIGDFGSPDGEFMPLVRVAPIYPHRARVQAIEGWVMLEFTITKTGTVTSIRVIESSHVMFESTAVRALEKFKYRPRIVNGQPVAVSGVEYQITFQLED